MSSSTCKRSRNGCWTCRKRKKKCGSSSTPCDNCARLGLVCKREVKLLWEGDPERVGMKRRGPRKSHTKTPANDIPVVLPTLSNGSLGSIQNPHSASLGRNPSMWPGTLSADDTLLLEHYVHHFSRTYPACSGPTNPFLSILLPLSLQSRVVLDSLLALGAVQSWKNECFTMEGVMLRTRGKALGGIRDLLNRYSEDINDSLSLLAGCVLLLLYEKLAGEGQQNWTPHLRFLAQFLRQHFSSNAWAKTIATTKDDSQSDALRFLVALFSYNDLVSSTSTDAAPWSDIYLGDKGTSYLDRMFPVASIEQIRFTFPRLITRLSAGDLNITDADFAACADPLDWIPSFALNPTQEPRSSERPVQELYERSIICELYRVAAMVYRRQRFRKASQENNSTDTLDPPELTGAQNLAIQACNLLSLLPDDSVYDTSLLWPIGIIARELDAYCFFSRAIISSKLQSLEERFHMRHFGLVRKQLCRYWDTRDLGLSQSSNNCILLG